MIIMDRGQQGRRRHVRGAGVARRSRRGRIEPRADLPARHRPRPPPAGDADAMIGASLYIIVCSARNRMRAAAAAAARAALSDRRDRRRRLSLLRVLRAAAGRRMRAPRAGARAGAAVRARCRRCCAPAPAFGGLALLVVAAVSWLLPVDSGLLDFSEAETAVSVSRAGVAPQLLMHRHAALAARAAVRRR